ncbi:WAP four-disulfide core domain protein 18-like [Acomys russatus]|uniref:WAP four-disulfide core domain protein 18-like n=1 Tax=Acomys russatus TaxID=60746 RepID=UPI0021E246B1|nr:WAP four-disulfide core domain protein 18-like [Acomys russatus]
MRTATVWVLVALISVEMIACALSSPKKLQKPGACPEPPPEGLGVCIDRCIDDKSCPKNQKCCSTGCGHHCSSPVFNTDGSPVRAAFGNYKHD